MSLQKQSKEKNILSQIQTDSLNENLQQLVEESSMEREEEIPEPSEEFSRKTEKMDESEDPQLAAFRKNFEEQVSQDLKLQSAIDFMESTLAQGGTPHFRNFWEARRLCLPLFKENISPALRGQLWNRYSELSKEARQLKEILDEQSAFAVEQIEIAIQALENDIQQFDENVAKSTVPDNLIIPQTLQSKLQIYLNFQKQLNVLNVQASRINALRKELLKTEMRVRHKNKFFQRLSAAGDLVFPKRKELIKQISQLFVEDVNYFIQAHFNQESSHDSLYALREEIKALQGLAKQLTLNTNSFTQTRTRLSECWDKIKIEEKERKKERAHQKVLFKQNANLIKEQLQLCKAFVEQTSSTVEAQKKLEEIITFMRRTELGRDELKELKEELSHIRKIVHDKAKHEEDLRYQQEQERNRQKKEKFNTFKELADNLVSQAESYELMKLTSDRDQLLAQLQESSLTKSEKIDIERILRPLRDIITEKNEKAMLAISDDDRYALKQLQDVLRQRKERRQEIKKQLEILRKASGSSNLDFEKAMLFTSQIHEEKERFERATQGIVEIEKKIVELQSKIKRS
ncbi:hypothetical protein [Candidatus Protochlamydia amoebophila]|uniref:Uncharacterized protein n=1 Tax=Candidatus Protochlamydia amoebophila TaxID=362787 RepID=A0A0C1JIX8_9BACT|nr:hypothetical protein [Candidatus Protochlamydia amoebophila]KIC71335.1 hypothetical protein DB44_DX00080 [Candidatus Protochlamydia amoebophila]